MKLKPKLDFWLALQFYSPELYFSAPLRVADGKFSILCFLFLCVTHAQKNCQPKKARRRKKYNSHDNNEYENWKSEFGCKKKSKLQRQERIQKLEAGIWAYEWQTTQTMGKIMRAENRILEMRLGTGSRQP